MLRLSLLLCLMTSIPASAEPRTMVLTKGVICETAIQVEQQLTKHHFGDFTPVEGCGEIIAPIIAQVTEIGWYETPSFRAHVHQFLFMPPFHPLAVQYGWMKWELHNPEFPI